MRETDRSFSVRQVATRVGVQPSYLSKIERGEQPPPSETTIRSLTRLPDHAVLRIVREVRDGDW